MPQSQEEFYFSLPYHLMDLCLFAVNNGIAPDVVAEVVGLTADQVEIVFRDIGAKRRATRYLHARPALVAQVFED
jgi:NAD+ synthase